MSLAFTHLFRLVHIISAVFWTGTVIFLTSFLFPTVKELGPVGGAVMDQLTRVRRVPTYLTIAGWLTILSGAVLLWADSQAGQADWMRSGPGMTFSIGGLFALIAAVLGGVVSGPTAKKLGGIAAAVKAAGGPPSAEQAAQVQALQGRLTTTTRVVAALLTLAMAAMAVARYVP